MLEVDIEEVNGVGVLSILEVDIEEVNGVGVLSIELEELVLETDETAADDLETAVITAIVE